MRLLHWEEANRSDQPPLHIGEHGARYPTLTGVWWLDEYRLLVNHRSGLRLALFDLREGPRPLVTVRIPHLTDDVSAKPLHGGRWEVAVSGCWDSACSLYEFVADKRSWLPWRNPRSAFWLLSTHRSPDKSFCHGVAYDHKGRLWLAYNCGRRPRVEIFHGATWQLPEPWGARDVCFDDEDTAYAVATSSTPKRHAYAPPDLSIWRLGSKHEGWEHVVTVPSAHTDACDIFRGRIWVNDQNGDRILSIDLKGQRSPVILKDDTFSFPHGVAISPTGMLAVTNYGTSTVSLIDLKDCDPAD
ncbi:MAG: hypothetical protein RL434_229 [Pseudomonadota bacterium]